MYGWRACTIQRPVNAYLLSSVNEAVESITASHDKVDFLVQSQGMATIQGFTPSPEEGLDQKLALHVRIDNIVTHIFIYI